MILLLYAGTIFTSAFLLFLVQPIVSKHILPWFGGSAAVWAVSLSFFQVLLLAGYAYADWTSRRLKPRTQVFVHVALLVLALLTLGVLADASWKPVGNEDPMLRIVLALGASVGLPYFLLSATGPLIQSWTARSVLDARVYRLFSLSNLASLLGLLAYPFVIEPWASLGEQAWVWSLVYGAFTLMCATAGWMFLKRQTGAVQASPLSTGAPAGEVGNAAPRREQYVRWFALSALGSWLLVATTNHLTRDVASVPLLWIVPLVLYLLSFVLCFESDRWYRRNSIWAMAVLSLTMLCALLVPMATILVEAVGLSQPMPYLVTLFSAGLFLQCMFLHGELALRRPAREHLTRFYLFISLGGAVGGLMVSLVAPRVLPAYYEFGLAYVLLGILAFGAFRGVTLARVVALATILVCSVTLALKVASDLSVSRELARNFYGTLSTSDHRTDKPEIAWRQFAHGSILHGTQFLAPARRTEATSYYTPASGLGRAIDATRGEGQRIGVIGLGAGTTAVYGRAGDVHRYYEINSQVIDIAQREFSFLRDSAARIELALGDARLVLERESPQGFDVLAVDAFSGDSVPAHLLTREALAAYLRHMKPNGIVAFHVSNKHLALAPIVAALAADAKCAAAIVVHVGDGKDITRQSSEWVLVSRNPAALEHPAIKAVAQPVTLRSGQKLWTDDHNDLISALK